MATTPTWDLPLPDDGQTPWGDDYRAAMLEIDQRLGGLRGSLFVEDNTAATQIDTADTPAVANLGPNVQEGPPCAFCDVNGTGRLTYQGPLTRVPTVTAQFTVECLANRTVKVALRKNGDPVPGGATRLRLGPNVTFSSGGIACNVEVETGDFLELFVANETSTDNITVRDLTLAARG